MKYLLNPDVVLVTVLEESMLVDVDSEAGYVKSMRGINETGVYYWKKLEKSMDIEEIIAQAVSDYEITDERARTSFVNYLRSLRDAKYLTLEE